MFFLLADVKPGRYHVVESKVTHEEAEDICFTKFGGYPADILDEYEMELVGSYISVR